MNYTVLVDIIVLSDWEGKNRYRVRNTLGQDVYFAAEGENIPHYTVSTHIHISLLCTSTKACSLKGVG